MEVYFFKFHFDHFKSPILTYQKYFSLKLPLTGSTLAIYGLLSLNFSVKLIFEARPTKALAKCLASQSCSIVYETEQMGSMKMHNKAPWMPRVFHLRILSEDDIERRTAAVAIGEIVRRDVVEPSEKRYVECRRPITRSLWSHKKPYLQNRGQILDTFLKDPYTPFTWVIF